VVALDHGCRAVGTTALDHVGIQRALHEILGVGHATGVLLEDTHEQLADDLALGLGFGHAGEPVEELLARIHVDEFDPHVATEGLDHLIALAFAHEPGVDVNARELCADGAMHKRSSHARVDTTGEPADHTLRAHLRAYRLDLFVDDRAHCPRGLAAGELVEESLQHVGPERRVHDLGVILHTPDASRVVLEHRHRRVGSGRGTGEAGRHPRDGVEVTHPHVLFGGKSTEQSGRAGNGQPCASVFAPRPATYLATQLVGDELRAVTNTQDRHPGVVHRRIEPRSTVHVHALGATREDDRRRLALGDLGRADRVRDDLGIDVVLTDSAGDELGVLRTEIHHEDGATGRHATIVVPGATTLPARWAPDPRTCHHG